MKKLYYVPMYHFRQNCWSRWMITALSEDEAKRMSEDQMGDEWRHGSVQYVCRTPDDVFKEV